MRTYFIILFFFGLAYGFADSVRDISESKFDQSILKKWESDWFGAKDKTWKNKWKNGDPEQGARFFLSSSLFVFTTDLWHFCKFIQNLLLVLTFVLIQYGVYFVRKTLTFLIVALFWRASYGFGFVLLNWILL